MQFASVLDDTILRMDHLRLRYYDLTIIKQGNFESNMLQLSTCTSPRAFSADAGSRTNLIDHTDRKQA